MLPAVLRVVLLHLSVHPLLHAVAIADLVLPLLLVVAIVGDVETVLVEEVHVALAVTALADLVVKDLVDLVEVDVEVPAVVDVEDQGLVVLVSLHHFATLKLELLLSSLW